MAKLALKVEIDRVELGKQGKSHENHFDDFATGRKALKKPGKRLGRAWWRKVVKKKKKPSLVPSIGKGQAPLYKHTLIISSSTNKCLNGINV